MISRRRFAELLLWAFIGFMAARALADLDLASTFLAMILTPLLGMAEEPRDPDQGADTDPVTEDDVERIVDNNVWTGVLLPSGENPGGGGGRGTLGDVGAAIAGALGAAGGVTWDAIVAAAPGPVQDFFGFLSGDVVSILGDFVDDPLGFLTGPLAEYFVIAILGAWNLLFDFIQWLQHTIIDALRQSTIVPIADIWNALFAPLYAFLSGYQATLSGVADGTGLLAPFVVIAGYMPLILITIWGAQAIFNLIGAYTGVHIDKAIAKRASNLPWENRSPGEIFDSLRGGGK